MLTSNSRYSLIEKLAEKLTDDADMETVLSYFYQAQLEYFDGLSDEDLLNEAEGIGFDVTEYEENGEY